ncbi:polyphosphate kinase 2 [Roseicitreum antarcticum]|uniref:ADP/GDP-polyphosphate phosphotransferase n=1 Tax=Roseicitreum antarcticum TaxID=564137 RepID=A0A1H3CFV0_9RHOB|nr:polyphosphate kinase 2 [Roseicitreum antarcticum]SDX52956.1 polyphosphate kinase 2, PA0141 family [Roseicitreum antarcticum]
MTILPLPEIPFDGAISQFYENEAPKAVRKAVENASKRDILSDSYPYDRWMEKNAYQDELKALQVELVKLQHWLAASGNRMVLVFEGRDTAGKGGAIRRLTEPLNPRIARVEALPKPTDRQQTQWYFQRYIERLPAAGEMVIFDRSWYNRGVVEHVFGFCTPAQRELFFRQVRQFETMLAQDGIRLVKFWLNIGQAEQLRRMLARERDVLKQWKLSSIDVGGLSKWDAYSNAIHETLTRSHHDDAPWTVIRAEDKYRTRLAVIRHVLGDIPYPGRPDKLPRGVDTAICGGPALWQND